ncbi:MULTISPECIES: hypothetical protein [Mycobacterium]|uniref:Uncharacterized protein n=1 Tax=Mycobacterium kiyosense TaxID=2871094 RepID=A0A9P3Q4L1_9MYCO|nr:MULTISPECIES: hypothetical protein [Mycobacterium]BDB41545.1 hypothetical protein IWGMT90018_19910 [Mycobacterium kiyosense]BDE15154.1 hypothetical protein MKCMC460_40140 [Mycobacterium sp. 20KCMC460]GLB81637.1 hypothetical protein SRL2020028_08930 [Mycobacterium kiyosense]GLB87584.1 hypothetical protein SRL2020130_04010 [Mycobacterium kiyosense]GLB94217.1 hypothetical protein SRL2020226_09930 [Mycobacterium kiyosense]
MFEKERIVHLHNRGYCTGYISLRLDVSSDLVRAVVAKHAALVAIAAMKPDAVRAARRAKAESKRAKALRLLAEADSVLR